MAAGNTSEAILNVLKGNSKPMNADEIAFRTRTTRTIINEILERMLRVKMVRQTAGGYQLNESKEYDLIQAFRK